MSSPAFDARYELADRYARDAGRVYLTGVQALVRLPLMQRWCDEAAGLNTAGFISGYRGSPLGTYDMALWQAKDLLDENRVRFEPGVNEDLAATAVWGSQQSVLQPGPRFDGVFGIWYGKGPGVDRSCDPIKHANYMGTAAHGGVLALMGDDPGAKSSSIAHQSEYAMVHCGVPVLNPANVQEYIDLGLHGFALSRFSGCWVGFKCLTDTVDSAASVEVGGERARIVTPDFAFPELDHHVSMVNRLVATEEQLYQVKLPAAQAYVRANGLEPGRAREPTAAAGHRHHRQGLPGRAPGAGRARARRRARGRPGNHDLQGGDALAARAGGRARLLPGARGRAGRGGEAPARRGTARAPALQRARAPALAGQARRGGRPAAPERGRAGPRDHRRRAPGLARRAAGRGGAAATAARASERRLARAAPAPALLLLGLPAQLVHGRPGGLARHGRHRLPRNGRVAAPSATPSAPPRWAARAPTGSARRPSSRCPTSSRTWATAPTSTAGCSRSAPASPPG